MTYSGAQQAKAARDILSRALSALQAEPNIPPDVLNVTTHVAGSLGALFDAERASSEIDGKASVRRALEGLGQTLALLQDVRSQHQGIAQTTEHIARAMTLIFPLTQKPSMRPPAQQPPIEAPRPPVAQPAAAPPRPAPAPASPPRPAAAPAAPPRPAPAPGAATVVHAPQQPRLSQPQPPPPPPAAYAPPPPAPMASPAPAAPYAAAPYAAQPAPYAAPSAPSVSGPAGYGSPVAPQATPYAPQPVLRPHVPASPQPVGGAAPPGPYPGGVQAGQHAAAGRVKVEANIGATTESNFYVGFSGEISEGGIFLATYDVKPVSQSLDVVLTLPGGFEELLAGRVRWVREPHDGGETTPGMGIAFEGLTPQQRELILRFVRKRAPMFYDE